MSIRPLAILDLPQLYRFRSEAIGLDTARTLTRGNPLAAARLLAYMNPARHVYGAIANGDHDSVLGGIIHAGDDVFARLLYLAPLSNLKSSELPGLLENLSSQAGSWGAFHVLAEVDELSDAFVPLRKSGFSVYAWQRMWEVSGLEEQASRRGETWTRVRSVQLPAVQSLYHQIVPPLLQPVEPQPKTPSGWVSNDGMKCHVSITQGMHGIVVTPLIHPEASDVGLKISALIRHLPNHRKRPVYVCVRSYQAWLEPVLEDLGARVGQRQAVMVKHLARFIKDAQSVSSVPAGISIQPSRVSRMEGEK